MESDSISKMQRVERCNPLRVALIGNEAPIYIDKFPHANCRIIKDAQEISDADDLVFCVAHPKIVPADILERPRYGVWINHSSDLPQGRGWAPLQWSILKGLAQITVTVFKAIAECDAGPWAYKISFPVESHDTIQTLRRKDVAVSVDAFRQLMQAILEDKLVLHEQVGESSYWRRRNPLDSQLDTSKTLRELWDYIRVCDNSDYPAFFMIDGRKVILRHEVVE